MLDTREKAGGRMPRLLPLAVLRSFVLASSRAGLACGLAGSLKAADIPSLAPLGPDILGFRGGLCRAGDRRREIEPARIRQAASLLREQARRAA